MTNTFFIIYLFYKHPFSKVFLFNNANIIFLLSAEKICDIRVHPSQAIRYFLPFQKKVVSLQNNLAATFAANKTQKYPEGMIYEAGFHSVLYFFHLQYEMQLLLL